MSHIFISYARKDLDFAEKIVNALAEIGLDTWIDWEQGINRGFKETNEASFLNVRTYD